MILLLLLQLYLLALHRESPDQDGFGSLAQGLGRLEVEPVVHDSGERLDVLGQAGIRIEEISLITEDPNALAALEVFCGKGYTSDEVKQAYDEPVCARLIRISRLASTRLFARPAMPRGSGVLDARAWSAAQPPQSR